MLTRCGVVYGQASEELRMKSARSCSEIHQAHRVHRSSGSKFTTGSPRSRAGDPALAAAGSLLQARRDSVRQRETVTAAKAELQERELINLALLASALAGALRRRGVREPAASLAAEAGIG